MKWCVWLLECYWMVGICNQNIVPVEGCMHAVNSHFCGLWVVPLITQIHLVSNIQSDGLNSVVQEVIDNVPWMVRPIEDTASTRVNNRVNMQMKHKVYL